MTNKVLVLSLLTLALALMANSAGAQAPASPRMHPEVQGYALIGGAALNLPAAAPP